MGSLCLAPTLLLLSPAVVSTPMIVAAVGLGLSIVGLVYLAWHAKHVAHTARAEIEKRFPHRSPLRGHVNRLLKSSRQAWPRGLGQRLYRR